MARGMARFVAGGTGVRWRGRLVATVLGLALVSGSAGAGLAQGPMTTRVSVAVDGSQGIGTTFAAAISANGRFVAFESDAPNLTPFDNNNARDIFVRDLVANTTERVSVPQGGGVGNLMSTAPAISADGRFVSFLSQATNLVPGDTNGVRDLFVRDRLTGTTERVSLSSAEAQANAETRSNAISGDGRFVAFESDATNLVSGDTNAARDVFLRDRATGQTERISIQSRGGEANNASTLLAMSPDGQSVLFRSFATNLIPSESFGDGGVFLRNRLAGTTERVSLSPNFSPVDPSGAVSMSAYGRYVAFASSRSDLVPEDTNGTSDVFVWDRATSTMERVSVSNTDRQSDGFSSTAGDVGRPAMSADGRYVVFDSVATNLVTLDSNGVRDVFIRDRVLGKTQRISVSQSSGQGNASSSGQAIDANGRMIAFLSDATNLVTGDTNAKLDAFVRDRALTDDLPTLSVSDMKVKEGSAGAAGPMQFTVALSQPSSLPVTFRFWTADVFARDGADYIGTFGTATLPAGALQLVIPVALYGDGIAEKDETFVFNIDMPHNATILDGQGVGTIENDDSVNVGFLDLTPPNARVAVHDRVLYSLEWTVPTGSWRDLKTIELRFGEGGDLLWVAFDEATRTLNLVRPSDGSAGPSFAPGSNNVLSTGGAQVHLAESRFVASGPTSPTVRLELSMSFGPQAVANGIPVEVRATADDGRVQGFDHAASLNVRQP